MSSDILVNSSLGKKVSYDSPYAPELLFPVPRTMQRKDLNMGATLPFQGNDIWTAFELSWLNAKGKPEAALAEFTVDCASPNLIESKSLKLYLNSFSQTHFNSMQEVANTITKDLTDASESPVHVNIIPLTQAHTLPIKEFDGICLDLLDVACDTYKVDPALLAVEETIVEETVFSHLFKSNCLITGQPDWGSVQIQYKGKKLNHENLLRYIVSYRNHQGFHEQCVERLFLDILKVCQPEYLTVYGRYTRRGGIDINPTRSTKTYQNGNIRLHRQ